MKNREGVRSLSLALGVSVALHGAFLFFVPGVLPQRRPPKADTVVVELAPPRDAEAEPSPPMPEEAAPPKKAIPAAPSATPSPPAPHDPEPPRDAKPAASGQPEASAPSPRPQAAAPAGPPSAPGVGRETLAGPAKPAPPALSTLRKGSSKLQDLLPKGKELAAFRAPRGLPDPAGGEAREATVGLGEGDTRYRGYLDQVQESVYGTWRLGKALLVAGRSRSVLLGLTLTQGGGVSDVQVIEGSGNPTLDAEAVAAVERARIPPFPPNWTIERLHLKAQFDYVFQ